MKRNCFLIVFCLLSIFTYAQFEPGYFMVNGNPLSYQALFPENYDESKQYPLVVFLYGSGERGYDNQLQLTHGKDFLINNFRSEYPAIVIVPQCPGDTSWTNAMGHTIRGQKTSKFGLTDQATIPMETLTYLITEWLNSGKVDTKQVYVGGLSMGGMGTYELLWRMPNTFAAAFPICGGGDVAKVKHYTKNTAVWIFHGDEDNAVSVELSRDMYKNLLDAGNEVKYTEYPGVKHDSWHKVFEEKELIPWLFSHKK